MKLRTVIFSAMLVLTACRTTPHDVGDPADRQIELAVTDGAMGKGAPVEVSTIENDPNGCKVYAYQADQTTGALIDNLSYSKSSTTHQWEWNTADKPIWPEESSAYPIRFFAVYSPHTAFFSDPLTRAKIRSFEFDTKATGNGTQEIMVATQSVGSLEEAVDPVPLSFKHVLSKVRFVVTTGSGVTAKIQSVRLVNVDSKRTYDMSQSLYTAPSTTPTDFGYLSVANVRTVSGTDVSLTADDNGALFMIPQNTAPWVNPAPWDPNSLTTGSRVEVVYRLFVGASGSAGYKDMVGYENHVRAGEVFATVSYPLDLATMPWSAGSAYRCTIKLGTGTDNGGILIDNVFVDPSGNKTTEPVTNPDNDQPIDNGTPVLGSINAPMGFGVSFEYWDSKGQIRVNQDDTVTSVVLTPSTDWLNVSPVESTQKVIVSGADWTSSVVGTGLTVSPSSGVAGTEATLTWAANTYPSERTARVSFIATANGYGTRLLRTSQRGSFGLLPSGDWLNVPALGASRKVRVMGSAWTATATGDGLSIDKTSGVNGDYLTLTWALHYGTPKPADRSGKVVITDAGGDIQTINTTQLGNSFMFTPAGAWADVEASGASLELVVTGAPSWNVSLTNSGGGLSIDKTSGKSGDKITVTWASNVGVPAPAGRTGTLTFTGSNGLGTIEFTTNQLGGTPPVPTGDYVQINGVKWAVGNLVANSATAGAGGVGALKVGAPTDGGLYFCFGSLVGYRGGSAASGGTGVGMLDPSWEGKAWGGAALYVAADDMLIWPTEMTTPLTSYPGKTVSSGSTSLVGFFAYVAAPWNTAQSIAPFDALSRGKTLAEGGYAAEGVGDPCRYYLGSPWRLPVYDEVSKLNIYLNDDKPTRKGAWAAAAPFGRWIGEDASLQTKSIFIPASGEREIFNPGRFYNVGTTGLAWTDNTAAVANATGMMVTSNDSQSLTNAKMKGSALPVRCVYGN